MGRQVSRGACLFVSGSQHNVFDDRECRDSDAVDGEIEYNRALAKTLGVECRYEDDCQERKHKSAQGGDEVHAHGRCG